jgi:hypothetical protein
VKKIFLLLLIFFSACNLSSTEEEEKVLTPEEIEFYEKVDKAVKKTLSEETTTTKPTNDNNLNESSINQVSLCITWVNATKGTLGIYQSTQKFFSDDTYDYAYGYITDYSFTRNLNSYLNQLVVIKNNQNSFKPNEQNLKSHKHILEAIDKSISAIQYTLLAIELNRDSYFVQATELQQEANQSLLRFTNQLKNCK